MSESVTFLDAVVSAVRAAADYNRNDQVPPAAVLWTDKERQWEALVPRLREQLPLLTFGAYRPTERTGPAYWVRCMIAGTLEEDRLPADATPVIYLPGVSRQEMRAAEECPRELQPLVELQYRGVLWTQKNGRDWTVAAFLRSQEGGLGIQVGADNATKESMLRALSRLADEPVLSLGREAPLRAPFFDALLNPDPIRTLLLWLNDPVGFRQRFDDPEWAAFRARCKREYGFDPEKDGDLTGGQLLGQRTGAWDHVWTRFEESPWSYPNLPDLLRRARPQGELPLFGPTQSWPQDNEAAEDDLRQRLHELPSKYQADARTEAEGLEAEHAGRRDSVWADLGLSPLAVAMEHISTLARETHRPLSGETVTEIAASYTELGWRADAAALDALAAVEKLEDVAAVKAALLALYGPWLETAALAFQSAATSSGLAYPTQARGLVPAGTCLLFSDGLRFDLGRSLASDLEKRGLACYVTWQLAALPGVTSTAKPAVSPVADRIKAGPGLDVRGPTGDAALTAEGLRSLMVEAEFQILKEDDLGDPSGRGWTELGDIDTYGHEHGWKVAHHATGEIRSLMGRIEALLHHGWTRVVVVTDHGWLMLPEGLPKADLPEHLTEVRKGRCARLKEFAATDEMTVPWRWDPEVRIATPRGMRCYEAGRECEHGGLSPQECVVPVITVALGSADGADIRIDSVTWRGLRCTVGVVGAPEGACLDLRVRAGDANSSLVGSARPLNPDGTAALLVEDDDRIGESVYLVVLNPDGKVLAQIETTVGG